jgi:hypothetical protein
MPWFVRHQATLYSVAASAAVAANWPLREARAKPEHRFLIGAGRLLAAGVYLSLHPFLRVLEANRTAYRWSLASLLPLIAFALWSQVGDRPVEQNGPENGQLGHSEGLLIAAAVSVIYTAGSRMRLYSETRTMAFRWSDAEFTLWSFISHLMLAIVVVSGINLVFMLAAKTAKPRSFRRAGVCVLVLSSLWFALSRFLETPLSFAGWAANVYAGTLAVALTLYGFLIVRPFLDAARKLPSTRNSGKRSPGAIVAWIVLAASAALAGSGESLLASSAR